MFLLIFSILKLTGAYKSTYKFTIHWHINFQLSKYTLQGQKTSLGAVRNPRFANAPMRKGQEGYHPYGWMSTGIGLYSKNNAEIQKTKLNCLPCLKVLTSSQVRLASVESVPPNF